MTRNSLYSLFAIAALLLATNVAAFSYFAAARIKINTAEINNTEAIRQFVEVMSSIGYTQGASIDPNGVKQVVVEDERFISMYFLAFVGDNLSRERFEVTIALDKNKHEIEVYFRELMTKSLSDLGRRNYQSLVNKLSEKFGSDKVAK